MRDPVSRAVARLSPPALAQRKAALAAFGSMPAHEAFMGSWPCLNSVELCSAGSNAAPAAEFTVAAWNMERCKDVGECAGAIASSGADLVLATEMDRGMARSGQRDTPRELAELLGWNYAFGVEYVELGLGDEREARDHSGEVNRHGLHGNAILSRYRISDVRILPIGESGVWFVDSPKGDGQARVGARMALAARLETESGPIAVVAAHYESESSAEDRAVQTASLLRHLRDEFGDRRCVIGGDLNTHEILQGKQGGRRHLERAAEVEPSFELFAADGFSWLQANTGNCTTRGHPDEPPRPQRHVLDWLLVRELRADHPFIVPAVGRCGEYLSDHEIVGARIAH